MFLARRIFTGHIHVLFQICALENEFSETHLAHYQTFTNIVSQKSFSINILQGPEYTSHSDYQWFLFTFNFSERWSYSWKKTWKLPCSNQPYPSQYLRSKLTIKTLEQRSHWRRSGVFVNFEHISLLVLVFLLLTSSR